MNRQASKNSPPQDSRTIIIDDRETSSKVVEVLSNLGASIRVERLAHGDYAIGDRILVERKTARDFVDTLINRDLLGQVKEMAEAVTRPVLIIEGGDLYTQRDVHPNAIRGVLAALAVDMGVSLLFTRDEQDTAQMLFVLAKREEGERGERKVHPHKSHRSLREEQEYIVSSFPEIGMKNCTAPAGAFWFRPGNRECVAGGTACVHGDRGEDGTEDLRVCAGGSIV